MHFSAVQQQIIDRKGGNMLVSAAAGSGKTTIMVERIVRMITDPNQPVDLDRLLVVTFTNAAASNMKEKIGNKLNEMLAEAPDQEQLQEQLLLLPNASVTTIHSFCLKTVRDYIGLIPELDPGVRVADENERALLLKDSLAEALESLYADAEKDPETFLPFKLFVNQYSGLHQDQGLEELALSLFSYVESLPNSFAWLKEKIALYEPGRDNPLEESLLKNALQDFLKQQLELLKLYLSVSAMVSYKRNCGDSDFCCTLLNGIDALLAQSKELCSLELAERIFALSLPAWPRLYVEEDESSLRLKSIREKIKNNFKENELLNALRNPIDDEALSLSHEMLIGLEQLLTRLSEHFYCAKKERNLIDFSDFERYALQILCEKDDNGLYPTKAVPTAAAKAVRDEYDYIFIDEYQDSNLLQEMLLTAVSRRDDRGEPNNIFMVGDMKQSIYRFRHAEPELFIEKLHAYPPYEEAAEGEAASFSLQMNYRSLPQILDSTNYLCESLMQNPENGIVYGAKERLYSEKENDGLERVSLLLVKPVPDELGKNDRSEQLFEKEANAIVDDIQQKLESGMTVYDASLKADRPLRLSDIVILLHSVKSNFAQLLQKALARRGIACFAESTVNYYQTPEIRLMRGLLQIIDNPRQDIPLAAVMHSSLFGFTADDMAEIRLCLPDSSFYEALLCCAEGDKDISGKARSFLTQLYQWREASFSLSVHDLLWQILNQSAYYYQAATNPVKGRFRRANLDKLLESTLAFERTSYSGLYQFLRYLELLDKNEESTQEAKVLGENENLVRIMTIHKSKGLEFPLVYLAGLGQNFNETDLNKKICTDRELGLGICAYNGGKKNPQETITRLLIKDKTKRKMRDELMRVLYVAMTRAQSMLVMSGFVKDPGFEGDELEAYNYAIGIASASGELPPAALSVTQIMDAHNYLDWIFSAIQAHRTLGIRCPFEFYTVEPQTAPKSYAAIEPESSIAPAADAASSIDDYDYPSAFSWTYPYQAEGKTFARFSVTEIKKKLHVQDEEEGSEAPVVKPLRCEEGPGARRGTVMHAFLANARMDAVTDEVSLKAEIDRQLRLELLSEEDCGLLLHEELLTFFRSELCRRILQSPSVFREQPFIIRFSADEMNEIAPGWMDSTGFHPDSTVMVQGIIDLFFFENGRIILVDYKTDRSLGPEQRLQYGIQLKLYKIALERILHQEVAERMLYATRTGEIIPYQ